MKKRTLFGVLILSLMLILAGCGSSSTNSSSDSSDSSDSSSSQTITLDQSVTTDTYTLKFTQAVIEDGEIELDYTFTNTGADELKASDELTKLVLEQNGTSLTKVTEEEVTDEGDEVTGGGEDVAMNQTSDYNSIFELDNSQDNVSVTATIGGTDLNYTINLADGTVSSTN